MKVCTPSVAISLLRCSRLQTNRVWFIIFSLLYWFVPITTIHVQIKFIYFFYIPYGNCFASTLVDLPKHSYYILKLVKFGHFYLQPRCKLYWHNFYIRWYKSKLYDTWRHSFCASLFTIRRQWPEWCFRDGVKWWWRTLWKRVSNLQGYM